MPMTQDQIPDLQAHLAKASKQGKWKAEEEGKSLYLQMVEAIADGGPEAVPIEEISRVCAAVGVDVGRVKVDVQVILQRREFAERAGELEVQLEEAGAERLQINEQLAEIKIEREDLDAREQAARGRLEALDQQQRDLDASLSGFYRHLPPEPKKKWRALQEAVTAAEEAAAGGDEAAVEQLRKAQEAFAAFRLEAYAL